MVGTARRSWNLKVLGSGKLAFVAPHGTFPVKRIEPDVATAIAQLPTGIEIAKKRIDASDFVRATSDLAIALEEKHDLALAEYERLPAEEQAKLVKPLVAWQRDRPATWRALRFLPLARWSIDHVTEAFAAALKTGGTFGAGPGIEAEALVDELARRGKSVDASKKQLAKLRKSRATEGDTHFKLAPELDEPSVVGACAEGVYVAGLLDVGEAKITRGAWTQSIHDHKHVLVLYARDGRELRRWIDLQCDNVVGDVALLTEEPRNIRAVPRGVRLSDGEVLYEFARGIERHDHELVWGIVERDWAARSMTSEVRRITGELVTRIDSWIEELWWDREHIYIKGESEYALDRNGKPSRAAVRSETTIDIEAANGRVTIDAELAPWRFGYWDDAGRGGWQTQHKGKKLLIAPSEPGAAWVSLELAKAAETVVPAPPWIAITLKKEPTVFIAIAELASAFEIRVDGKRFVKRATADRPRPPKALADRYDKLVEIGITPERTADERDTHLLRVFDTPQAPSKSTVARVLAGHSPFCVEHDRHWFYPDDDFYDALTHALADQGITVEETGRVGDDPPIATIRITRDTRTLEARCEPMVYEVAERVDGALRELGSARRLYALAQYQEDMYAYLAITQAQRARAVEAGIEGIHPSATMPYE